MTYGDTCEFNGVDRVDPTCTGTAKGQTIRAGMLTQYRHDAHWVFLARLPLRQERVRTSAGTADNPPISSNTVFFRGQYSF